MKKIKLLLAFGTIVVFLTSCDQLNSAYLVNDSSDTVDVVLSIINLEEVETTFAYRKLSNDSTANIYKLPNQTTRIEFSLCSKCEFEMFFDTTLLKAANIGVDSLKILKQNGFIQYNSKEEILNAFVKREHYTKKYLMIKN